MKWLLLKPLASVVWRTILYPLCIKMVGKTKTKIDDKALSAFNKFVEEILG